MWILINSALFLMHLLFMGLVAFVMTVFYQKAKREQKSNFLFEYLNSWSCELKVLPGLCTLFFCGLTTTFGIVAVIDAPDFPVLLIFYPIFALIIGALLALIFVASKMAPLWNKAASKVLDLISKEEK